MYLKSVDLHGFKSFTERTRLQFGQGISVIVGPNGSGKSNVADAVRWVLGEQSARTLRGSKMEDVIFAGTKSRKPLGMAEVSIVLDNLDGRLPVEFNEVTVTRRAYRSGEGEYLINNVPCRLKDVHNLFVDTGIGADGFSIIGQGRVEEIINSRPEERRSLIEETAGIVKYRNRKREAAKKLQETEQNLERIRDIISELSNQVGPLEEQAKKAGVFKRLKGESDELEISLAVQTMEELKTRLDEVQTQFEEKKIRLSESESRQAIIDARIEELKLSLSLQDEEITSSQQDLFHLSGDIERHESEKNLIEARKEAASVQVDRLSGELSVLEEKINDLDISISEEEKKGQELGEAIQIHREQFSKREGTHRDHAEKINSLEEEGETIKARAFDLVQKLAGLRNEINNREQRILAGRHSLEKLLAQEEEFNCFINNRAEQAELIQKCIREQEEETVRLKTAGNDLEDNSTAIKERRFKMEADEKNARESLERVKSRLHILSEMQQEYEGYYPGVKAVLNAGRRGEKACADLVGVVAELIKVPEQYRMAVETVLGGSLQHLVTKTDQGAKEAIEFLKKNRSGRATFLPLNVVRPPAVKDLEPMLTKLKGVCGLAADLISCPDPVRPAIEFLLKRVLVVEHLEAALQAARTTRYGVRIVTLDGDVINPGGSLSGGSPQKKSGTLLSRINEMEKLAAEAKELEAVWQKAAGSLTGLQSELEKLQSEKERILNEMHRLEIDLNGRNQELQQIGEALVAARENLATVRVEMQDNEQECQRLLTEKDELTVRLSSGENENEAVLARLTFVQEELKAAKENLAEGQEDLTEIKVRLAAMVQEESAFRGSLHRMKEEQNEFSRETAAREKEKADYLQEISLKEADILRIGEELLALKGKEVKAAVLLEEMRHRRTAEAQLLDEKDKESRENAKHTAHLQGELHQVEMKQSRLEMEWEKNLDRLSEKFRLSFAEARLLKIEMTSKKAARERIAEIERDLENLGPVNLNAIEEFQRVNERYQFLTRQEEDMSEAREALFRVIAEMDRIMTKRFRETYAAISNEFTITFAHLFGGGLAELRLTDPENILETGVEIIVQPPGKKIQHHNLLSGGEKALTGIALLFAVLKVRPSPFCILDEIEAALDEANVDRFADYMRTFSGDTQFIVVTHRQGTMEVADVLYGITMEENGVSKTVSVKLAS